MSDRNYGIQLLLVKVESTEGTDAVPTVASDAVPILEGFAAGHDFASRTERPRLARGTHITATKPLPPKGRIATWPFTVQVRGARSVPYTATNHDLTALLRACGMASTFNSAPNAESYTYNFAHTALNAVTLYAYNDGVLRKLLGAKADATLRIEAGAPASLDFSVQGLYGGRTDVAMPSVNVPTDFGSLLPPLAESIVFQIDGFSVGIIRRVEYAFGNVIQQRSNVNAPGGVAPPKIRARAPRVTIVLEEPLASAKDFEAMANAGTLIVCQAANIGSTQYQRFRPRWNMVIEKVTPSDDNGTAVITLEGGAHSDSLNDGIDELSLLFD